jgi:Aspartyl protease
VALLRVSTVSVAPNLYSDFDGRRTAALIEGIFVLTLLLGKLALAKAETLLWRDTGRIEWFVPGSLGGFHVSAIPDTGSDLDIVSFDFVSRHGIKIDSSCAQNIRLPNGITRSIGSISLPFSFDGENSLVHRVFIVLPNCLHDVILSNAFLKTTETLTKFSRRLKTQVVPLLHGPRLRLLGTPKQRIWGSINGHTVGAIPDTGSDVMLMSKRYAKKLRLDIRRAESDKTCLEFADGTLANTYGMVYGVEWRFGGKTSAPRFCDFHVMDDLPYKVILSNNFLFKSKAFSQYKDFFFEQQNDGDLNRSFHELSLIKMVGGQNKTLGRLQGYYHQIMRVMRRSK